MRCFQSLHDNVTSALQLLNLEREALRILNLETESDSSFDLVLHFGFHNMVYNTPLDAFYNYLAKTFENLSQFQPRVRVTWVSLYPLIEPAPGREAKFSNYVALNGKLASVAARTNELALSYGFQVFDTNQFIPKLTWDMSPDSVHLHASVDFFLAHELLNISTFDLALDSLHNKSNSLSDFAADDIFCGNQIFQAISEDQVVHVAFLGGAVTSDMHMITGFKNAARVRLRWTVKLYNLAEPSTDSLYQSLCWEQSVLGSLSRVHIVFLEYCSDDKDPNTTALRRLILSLSDSPQNPYIIYYCHYGPKNRLGQRQFPEKHWKLAHSLNITAVRNLFLLKNVLFKEESLLFRDRYHLTPKGGLEIGNLLVRALQYCFSSNDGSRNVVETISLTAPKVEHKKCFTSVGPVESRNLGTVASGWNFVESANPSAPNGRNGYESEVPEDCLSIHLNVTCPIPRVTLFHLSSNAPEMGLVNITAVQCKLFHQIVNSKSNNALPIAKGTVLSLEDCCPENGYLDLDICIAPVQSNSSSVSRFRVVAVTTDSA